MMKDKLVTIMVMMKLQRGMECSGGNDWSWRSFCHRHFPGTYWSNFEIYRKFGNILNIYMDIWNI